uniref:NADH-ubiquinone oxidoreductase chain 4 n=1 Tax=Eucnemidae sp. 4 ACP-2013 TaxID=1434503 RepID=A0A3G4RY43_9COLE|nr:NADH dehydrogenase subunit 4 [Eucnemidae sp. 4 ACP-2013]
MLKYILYLFFMIPLCFSYYYWMLYINMLILLFLFFVFQDFNNFHSSLSLIFGCDNLSFWMIMLTIWICSLMINSSFSIYLNNLSFNFFMLVMVIILLSLFLVFCSLNLFIFYFFFEVSMIPTLMMILGWGYQPERLQAGIYMFFYTFLMSLPMLVCLFYMYYNNLSFNFYFLNFKMDLLLWFLCFNLVFLVKLPMYFIHLWLPKAHVEAPISGSMILAGVMLKLGGYGMMRFLGIFSSSVQFIGIFLMSISLVGGFYVSLICLSQVDMKSLIAYSSVAHMGLILSGLLTMNFWGYWGCLVMMLGHGLCSCGLFCLANILYERMSSRNLFLSKGMINIMPSFSLWWFLLSVGNMAAPPSINLLGEIMLISSLMGYSFFCIIFLSLMSFFAGCYCLYLYSFIQHGLMNMSFYSFYMGFIREYNLLLLLWLPFNFTFLSCSLFL